jgi:hypothetical protein
MYPQFLSLLLYRFAPSFAGSLTKYKSYETDRFIRLRVAHKLDLQSMVLLTAKG